jgi:signal transduction histidine kinase/putative methionine-R-sulfoxide reductase with GAF domain
VPTRNSTRPAAPKRAALEDALRREARIAQALREVGAALGPSEELDDVLELVLDKTQVLLECERATLFLLDETTGDLVSRIVGGGQVRSVRLRMGYGIAGHVAKTGRTLRISDAYSDPRFEPEWDRLTGFRTRSMLATPLRNHLGASIGVIQVLNKRHADEFTQDDEELLIALSTQAAIAIDNSRLVLRLKEKNRQLLETQLALERRVRDLQLLFDLERSTARAESLKSLADAVLSHIAPACDARASALLVVQEDGKECVLFVTEFLNGKYVMRQGPLPPNALLGQVMQKSETRYLDAEEMARTSDEAALSFPVKAVIVAPLEGEEGPLGAVAIFADAPAAEFPEHDIELVRLVSANVSTALRLHRAAAARERSERLTAIGRLLSQVVHDFKTPMTVISGYAQLMVDAEDREQRSEYAEEIIRQFEMVTAMQREVLEFARGERTLFVRRIQLGRFFDELSRQVQRELEGTAIELIVDFDRKAIVRFDEGRMTRVLHNLIRNAIEAIGDKPGQLGVSAHQRSDSLVFEVWDTGPGIPKAIEGSLFQSFVTANKVGGTGLGLAIVKKAVEEHGGTIEVESSAGGARFRITIPQSVDAPVRTNGDGASTRSGRRASSRPPPRTLV